MICVPQCKDIPRLKEIWRESFGDTPEYISLFFDSVFDEAMPLAFYCDGRPAAVLYRLKCRVSAGSEGFGGRYIYAAATLEGYRRRGFMGQLLGFAQREAEAAGDFLALVPGTERLYEYYSGYGYVPAMSRGAARMIYDGKSAGKFEGLSHEKALSIRNRLLSGRDSFLWGERELSYAFKCTEFFGGEAVGDGESLAVLSRAGGELTVHELLSEAPQAAAQSLMGQYGCGSCVVHSVPGFGERTRYGMINSVKSGISKHLGCADIYMNLALD